jgi:hypothetical protein
MTVANLFFTMPDEQTFQKLKDYLTRVPGSRGKIGSGYSPEGYWWVKFTIDIDHRLAWHVVQELGYVLNYMSVKDRLPTVFMPVSPPPYLNGGPHQFLSWVIECRDKNLKPETCAELLEGRLPRPVDDEAQWNTGK